MKKIMICLAVMMVFVSVPVWAQTYNFFQFTDPIDSIVGYGTGLPSEDSEKGYLAGYLMLTVPELEALYTFDKNEGIGAFDYKDLKLGFDPGFSWDYAIVKVDGPNDYWYLFMDDNASLDVLNGDDVLTTPAQGYFLTDGLQFNGANNGISHVTWFKGSTQVPEPATLLLLGLGLVGLAGVKRKFNK